MASARELALADVQQARRALGIARRIAPLSPKLRDARQRLDAYAAQVGPAEDPARVAQHFFEIAAAAVAAVMVAVHAHDVLARFLARPPGGRIPTFGPPDTGIRGWLPPLRRRTVDLAHRW